MTHDDDSDDDVYDVSIETFDEVTEFKRPESVVGTGGEYLRLYDEETNTLLYWSIESTGNDRTVAMSVRDASDYAG
jgi:hypothetical protein